MKNMVASKSPKADKKTDKLSAKVMISHETSKAIFSNVVNFQRVGKSNILMTFIFTEPDGKSGTVVTRILVDEDHANKIVEVLGNFLNKQHD